MSPREAMVLSLLVPPDAEVSGDDVGRLAAQFGIPPDRVVSLIERIRAAVRAGGSTLDSCQPRGTSRCPHCGGVLRGGPPP